MANVFAIHEPYDGYHYFKILGNEPKLSSCLLAKQAYTIGYIPPNSTYAGNGFGIRLPEGAQKDDTIRIRFYPSSTSGIGLYIQYTSNPDYVTQGYIGDAPQTKWRPTVNYWLIAPGVTGYYYASDVTATFDRNVAVGTLLTCGLCTTATAGWSGSAVRWDTAHRNKFIYGQITDSLTGQALENAKVTITRL